MVSRFRQAEQVRLYEEAMGSDAATRQERLARLERGQCVCAPRLIRRKWDGYTNIVGRSVHDRDCPRYKPWMNEAFTREERW